MEPFGKNMNAARIGAPVEVVASFEAVAASAAEIPRGLSVSKAGNAMQAPSPRRKCRRLKLAWRWAARLCAEIRVGFVTLLLDWLL